MFKIEFHDLEEATAFINSITDVVLAYMFDGYVFSISGIDYRYRFIYRHNLYFFSVIRC